MRPHPIRIKLLIPASSDFRFLLERGYPRDSALKFVGDHYQLHQRERDILMRSVFSKRISAIRKKKCLSPLELKGKNLAIDGYNVLITLESALKRKPLVLADDGFIRDISRVFRSFRPTELTKRACELIFSFLKELDVKTVIFYLDKPISKSGELSTRINYWLSNYGLKGNAYPVTSPEKLLKEYDGIVATADSVVLDKADKLFDLAGHIIRNNLKETEGLFVVFG